MRVIAVLAFLAIAVTGCGKASNESSSITGQTDKPVYVRVPTSMLSEKWVRKTGFNRDHGKNKSYALGWMSTSAFKALSDEEKSAITKLDAYQVARGMINPFTLKKIPETRDNNLRNVEDYHNYVALTQELKNLANAHSDIAELESIGKSEQGRELWMMKITGNIANDLPKPKLLYIANMHGDEVVGRELSIYYIRQLLNEYGTNPRVTHLVDNAQIFIIASMNPDGFELRQRYNNKSVDLNRNFPDFTSDDNDTLARRAVETAHVMNLHNQHHFISAINFHGGEVCFNLPWDTTPNRNVSEKFGDDAVLAKMGRAWADSNPVMRANTSFDRGLTYGYEWYEVDGGMQDWSIHYRKSMHATVELSYSKWPAASHLPKAWDENKEAMLAHMERSIVGVHIEAVNARAKGKAIPKITVAVNTSKRTMEFDGNFAWRTTSDGPQTVTVSAPGFKPQVLQVNARSFDGTFDRVVLSPR